MAKKKPTAVTRSAAKTRKTTAAREILKPAPPRRAPRATSAASAASVKADAPVAVELWTADEIVRPASPTARNLLQELAMRWQYRTENRSRWASLPDADARFEVDARAALAAWGFDEESLLRIASARVVEVMIPFDPAAQDSDDGWEARIFPWEYVLTTASRTMRSYPMLVVRRLMQRGRRSVSRKPSTVAFLAVAPGLFAEQFSFEQEQRLVTTGCGDLAAAVISNPTLAELRAKCRKLHPDLLHVSAVDTRLAISRMREAGLPLPKLAGSTKTASSWRGDGIVLRSPKGLALVPVSAAELAQTITLGGSAPPQMVCFNVWFSASRVAAMTVAHGVGSAIGFQTSFDDSLAELFFAKFYRAYCASGYSDVLAAFQIAWSAVSGHKAELKGTGVVLWSAKSLVQPTQVDARHRARAASQISKAKQVSSQDLTFDELRSKLDVTVTPIGRLNYSLLHNNRPVFEVFRIRKYADGVLRSLKVEVTLFVGPDSYPFVRTFDFADPVVDLAALIRLPLTSELVRNVDENIQTNLHVSISCRNETLYQETHRITLLPIDLWKDSDGDRQWLPSFVLPRDPAVTQIIQGAQELLACLADDLKQGFDGYQSYDESATEPAAGVDRQVRAIWAALISKVPLSYINPPPSYEPESQRLRTPSQILHSGRGTCIDLALLMAACLEFVEIHPVIFLLNGHAFPGYWRSEEAHDELVTVSGSAADERSGGRSTNQSYSWVIGRKSYLEVMSHVTQGNLVPLESTLLAAKAGFYEAIEAGRENLEDKQEFHSLLDIRRARDEPVTPLPLGRSS